MFVWDLLGDDTAMAAVVPEAHAAYRQPIAAALRFFLENLPRSQVAGILAEQMALGPSAGVGERLVILARACPVLHKLGQVLARDRRLDPALRAHLQRLESMEPRAPIEVLRTEIERELGPLERLGLSLEPAALAEASVAVVVPFRYHGRADDGPQSGEGVFKVLKPGIEEQLGRELALLEDVGAYLDEHCSAFGIPPLDYREIFARVRSRLGSEVRLDQEQRNLTAARAAYTGWESVVQVPRLLPWSSPRVTAMERVFGRKVTDLGTSLVLDRSRLARRIVEALIAQPLWSTAPEALFHADPHAGNLLATSDGRLAILDWSLVGVLGERQREAMGQIVLGALTLDGPSIVQALHTLAERVADEAALRRAVSEALHRLKRGHLPGLIWLTSLLDRAVQSAQIRAEADLLMFRRMLLMLEGVVADVASGDGPDLDVLLAASFLQRLAGEWPRRAFAPSSSRAFGTRLSNADLARLAFSLPWTTARVGLQWWQEVLVPGRETSRIAG
jgi:ubiquinone biosynthesis protein